MIRRFIFALLLAAAAAASVVVSFVGNPKLTVDIANLKQAVPLERIVSEYVSLRRSGTALMGRCPFHDDRNPSFSLYDNATKWKCFSCGIGGDQLDFLERLLGSKEAALTNLRQMASGNPLERGEVFQPAVTPSQQPARTMGMSEWENFVAAFWDSQTAQAFLVKRGITEETARRFKFGFIADGNRFKSETFTAERNAAIAASGWIGYPYIAGEKVIAVKWRSVADLEHADRFRAHGGGMRTEQLFNESCIDADDDVYVVEGEMDAVTLEQAGFRAVALSSAGQRVTDASRKALLRAERIYLAGDNETSGTGFQAMDRLLKDLGDKAFILLWPRTDGETKKDANEFFTKDCNSDKAELKRRVHILAAEARKPNSPHFRAICDWITEMRSGIKPLDDPRRLRFPWPSVDKMALILPGDLVGLFADQEGSGKSSWCTQMCLYNVTQFDRSCEIYTPDLRPERHTRMIVSQLARRHRMQLTPSDFDVARGKLAEKYLYLGNDPNATDPKEVMDICEQGIRRLGGEILVIDTIDHVLRRSGDHRLSAADELIGRAGNIAAKYGVTVILVTQPRTQPAQAGKARSRWSGMEDMAYGRALRQEAAAIIGLSRKVIGQPKAGQEDGFSAEQLLDPRTLVRMLKGREQDEGKQSTWLHFKGEMATFAEEDNTHGGPPPYREGE